MSNKKTKKSFHNNIKSVSFINVVFNTLITCFLLFCYHIVFNFYSKKYDIVIYTYPQVFIIVFGICVYMTAVIKNRSDKDLFPRGIKKRMITAITILIVIIVMIFTSGIFITESSITKRICFIQHSYSYSEIKEAELYDTYEGFINLYNLVDTSTLEYRVVFNDGKSVVVPFCYSKTMDDSSYMKFDKNFSNKRTISVSEHYIRLYKDISNIYKEYLLKEKRTEAE